MAALELVATIILNLLIPPFIFVLSLTLVLAAFGRSLGVRRFYVRCLLKIFEVKRTLDSSGNNGINGGASISVW